MRRDRRSKRWARLPRRLRDWPLTRLDQLDWQVETGEPAVDGTSAAQPDRPSRPEPDTSPVGGPCGAAARDPQLLDPCLQGVTDEAALAWAATPPGPAVLAEAIAAAERCLAHVTAQRDVAPGVLARRRQAEADADAAAARAATARDGVGRPWAKVARSTAPTEVAARLSISTNAAAGLLDRGAAALEAHRDVGAAMATGAVSPALGTWLLDQLVALHAATEASTCERERARRSAALEEQRYQEDAQRAVTGQPALSASAAAALVRADAARADADAEGAAREHAATVTSEVKDELLRKVLGAAAIGAGDGSTDDAAGTSTDDASDDSADSPTADPAHSNASPEGLGDTREKWRRQLTRSVARVDPAGFEARARAKRVARSVTRWSEDDGQACIQLRGPAEDVALIGTAMDARAERRQQEARAAEREAARAQGRPFDRSAVGRLDAHRVEALKEWAVAALELAGTSGVSGTWYPITRTAASRPVVSVVMPITLPLGVSTVGAFLAGYGTIGAEAALRIAEDGFWRRVFSDPPTGVAVGVEEETYRPSTGERRLVGFRHPESTMPGSSVPADACDLDHITPWRDDGSGGATTAENLQPLAEPDHLLKQAGDHAPPGYGWRAEAGPPGEGGVVWRAPTGHTHRVLPQRLDPGPPDPTDWSDQPLTGWPAWNDGDGMGGSDGGTDWWSAAFFDDLPADPVDDDPFGGPPQADPTEEA